MSWSDELTGDDKLRAVIARQLEKAMAEKRWQPLPHQTPPPGDWMGWLLIAGRGAGKSAAASHYVVEHVHGPPCMDGPTPHWMAIIAPTLGDAATSCYSGPAGIRSFDPDAVMGQKIGGQVVTWPNGSQAKMYGAREPDDVERLRAGGNSSLVAGTLVRTARGEIPIELVKAGDEVWTRRGLRRVLRAGQTGIKPVRTVSTELGRELHLTGNHEVWTGVWREADDLNPGDTLTTWDTSCTTVHAGMSGLKPDTTPIPDETPVCCTATSGHERLVPSRREPSSIIGSVTTKIRLTSPDWNASHHKACTRRNVMLDQSSGIEPVVALPGTTVSQLTVAALTATQSYGPGHISGPSGARLAPVTDTLAETYRVAHDRGVCALCAATRSTPPDGDRPKLAHDRVRHVSLPTLSAQPVYDLLIEHDHEFFANDVLVANCLVWAEEIAAWRYMEDAFDQMRFGLRVGTRPRWIGTTTPKPRPLIKRLVKGEIRGVALSTASTYDNPHLPQHIKDALEEAYQGTSLGAQELLGRLVEQDENALWTREVIELNRVESQDDLQRIAVGVDPSGGAGEQGIVVVGTNTQLTVSGDPSKPAKSLKHGYVLDDRTVHLPPSGWGRAAVNAAVDWDADCIVVETNFGGDMAASTIVTAAEDLGVSVPVRTVRASRGKHPRAQPVSALSVQGRWHFVGRFAELEDQLCTWTDDSDWSPDRLDAMVWPAWYLKLVSTVVKTVGTFGGRELVTRTLGRVRR